MLHTFGSRLTYANVMATVAMFLALGGGAIAATNFIRSDGRIHGCVSSRGTLTVLRHGRHCAKGATAIAWNQQGPAGQVGAQGPSGGVGLQGPSGPKGEPGPSTGPAGGDLTGSYPAPTIASGAVTGGKVAANTLTGSNIDESSLAKVPAATDADNAATLAGKPPAQYADHCPSGFELTMRASALCTSGIHAAATWVSAYQTCALDAGLPSVADAAGSQYGLWTSGVFTDGGVTRAWVTGFDSSLNPTVLSDLASNTHPFYCVANPFG